MRAIFLNDRVITRENFFITPQQQIALSAWYPEYSDNMSKGYYDVTLITIGLSLALTTIFYDPEATDNNVWKEEQVQWKNLTLPNILNSDVFQNTPNDYFTTFSVVSIKQNDTFSLPNNWKYILFLKYKNEEYRGKKDTSVFRETKTFCSSPLFTTGEEKVAGAACPNDPIENNELKVCLNWRRLDTVGENCRKIMNSDEQLESAFSFCNNKNFMYSGDCRCLNRGIFQSYTRQKELNLGADDYTTYTPCVVNSFLKPT